MVQSKNNDVDQSSSFSGTLSVSYVVTVDYILASTVVKHLSLLLRLLLLGSRPTTRDNTLYFRYY